MLCCWVEDPNSKAFKLHLPRIFDYLWIAEDGMKMQVQTFTVKQFLIDLTSISLSLSLFLSIPPPLSLQVEDLLSIFLIVQ